MAVFRVEKTKDFTVMSNHHFRNRELSLKAKGLLSFMLSLSDEWDYTLEGLAKLNKDGVDSIRTAINELENAGYIERGRKRDEKGQLRDSEYIIYEQPILRTPTLDNPTSEEPILENPIQDNPMQENPTQLNIYKSKTKELNTNVIKYPSINQPEKNNDERWIDRYNNTVKSIKEQIDYDSLINTNNSEAINEIVEVMADVMLVDVPYYKIGNKDMPAELVRIRYRQLTYGKIEALLLDLGDVTHTIRSKTPYLISSLYNAANTGEMSMENRVKCDMYGGE
jgi:hypothetical protein